jgi:redox-sensitive bicupin YhaK (pirin superfamily)
MGNGSIIRPGDVQYMSAGTGVRHSEYNPSADEPVHLLQIWLLPNQNGVEPRYAQQHFAAETRRNRWALLVSPDGRDGSIAAHQDGLLFGTLIDDGFALDYPLAADRRAYLHVARGAATVNGELLRGGDAARIDAGDPVRIDGVDAAEVLLFDLP